MKFIFLFLVFSVGCAKKSVFNYNVKTLKDSVIIGNGQTSTTPTPSIYHNVLNNP